MMKKIAIRFITDKEIGELKKGLEQEKQSDKFAEIFEKVNNQTVVVLREVKNAHEWKDPEQMIRFVESYRLIESSKAKTIKLEDSQVQVIVEVMDAVAKSGKITGFGVEKFVDIYQDIKNAEKVPA